MQGGEVSSQPPPPVVGLLHPGAMGAVMGGVLRRGLGQQVLWAGDGRSYRSRHRATEAGLTDAGSLEALCRRAEVVLSICPPEAAEDLARRVAACGFEGVFVDANAVSPATARRIGASFDRYVDGGIIGQPPLGPGTTRLYLAGVDAPFIAGLFDLTPVEARLVDGPVGAASALKMCFASWTKGTSALLLAIRALAQCEGVSEALLSEWATSMPELVDRGEAVAAATGPKAWRFEAEMREIAATFAESDLPPQFHQGAADIYRRLAPLKGTTEPTLAEALALLIDGDRSAR